MRLLRGAKYDMKERDLADYWVLDNLVVALLSFLVHFVFLPGAGSHTALLLRPGVSPGGWSDLTIRQAAGLALPTELVNGYHHEQPG